MRLIGGIDLRVEAGEAQRAGHGVRQRDNPSEARQMLQRPKIDDQRRRHAEGRDIRQRIKLGTESAGTFQQPRNAAVDAIEHRRHHDSANRLFPFPGEGKTHARQAETQGQHGDGIGNQRAQRYAGTALQPRAG